MSVVRRRIKSTTSRPEAEIRTPRGSSMETTGKDLGVATRTNPDGVDCRIRCSAPAKLATGIPAREQNSAWDSPELLQASKTDGQSRLGRLDPSLTSDMAPSRMLRAGDSQKSGESETWSTKGAYVSRAPPEMGSRREKGHRRRDLRARDVGLRSRSETWYTAQPSFLLEAAHGRRSPNRGRK